MTTAIKVFDKKCQKHMKDQGITTNKKLQLEGYPVVGRGLWQYIADLFIDFDQLHHPQIFNGGLWLNQGFSSSDEIGPWDISMDKCRIVYT